jgi:hypothetical protein
MKHNSAYYIIIILVIIIIIFITFSLVYHNYLINEENIEVQQYSKGIFEKSISLEKRFPSMINRNYNAEHINNLIVVKNFTNPNFFKFLQSQVMNKQYKSSNNVFRKGHSIDFVDLHKSDEYEGLLELYYSSSFTEELSNILQKYIQHTPLSDNNACSLLIYSNKGDYIDWHLDFSNYYGDRYVVLLSLINTNKEGTGLSQNEFKYVHNGEVYSYQLEPNSLIIFKGSEILHNATAIGEGETRILLSMVFCDICQSKSTLMNVFYEKFKNFMFYNKT